MLNILLSSTFQVTRQIIFLHCQICAGSAEAHHEYVADKSAVNTCPHKPESTETVSKMKLKPCHEEYSGGKDCPTQNQKGAPNKVTSECMSLSVHCYTILLECILWHTVLCVQTIVYLSLPLQLNMGWVYIDGLLLSHPPVTWMTSLPVSVHYISSI